MDPPSAYPVGCERCGARYDSRFAFRPEDCGTEIEMEVTATPLSCLAKVMSVLIQPMMKRMAAECAKDVASIAAAAEKN